ncbi:MAG: response regulator [Deltaproteobacteria bacterium]|nr:response regulator [Deltaproteobacteria bacterium]
MDSELNLSGYKGRVAILDDEPSVRDLLGMFLQSRNYDVALAGDPEALYRILKDRPVDLLICDLYLGDTSGLDVIRKVHPAFPVLDIMVLTGYASIENVIEAFHLGATDFLQKPVNLLLLETTVERCLEKRRLVRQVDQLERIVQIHQVAESMGDGNKLPQLLDLVLNSALKTLSADKGYIALIDERRMPPEFRITCALGLASAERDRVGNLSVEERTSLHASLNSQIDRGEHRLSLEGSPLTELENGGTALVVPLVRHGNLSGFLALIRNDASRPFGSGEWSAAELLASNASLAIENARLYRDLEENYLSTIRTLAKALEARDKYTGGHAERVARYSRMLADMTDMDARSKAKLEVACILHDIGKLGISDYVLQKGGPLTKDERDQIRQHPAIGDQILAQVPSLAEERRYVYEHHERYDGSGYPRGLGGSDISLAGHILIMVEVYDALATVRSYKQAWTTEMIKEHYVDGRGSLYDPAATDLFLELLDTRLRTG